MAVDSLDLWVSSQEILDPDKQAKRDDHHKADPVKQASRCPVLKANGHLAGNGQGSMHQSANLNHLDTLLFLAG
jgi:hypothetical protein